METSLIRDAESMTAIYLWRQRHACSGSLLLASGDAPAIFFPTARPEIRYYFAQIGRRLSEAHTVKLALGKSNVPYKGAGAGVEPHPVVGGVGRQRRYCPGSFLGTALDRRPDTPVSQAEEIL